MQSDLQSKFVKQGYDCFSSGLMGKVYGKSDSKWVVKIAHNDGTRTYLEWVLLKSKRGERMKGMPTIDFLVEVDELKYMVAMKRYERVEAADFGTDYLRVPIWLNECCPKYISELRDAFEEDNPGVRMNDMHSANVMLSGKEWIVTDPNSSEYLPVGAKAQERSRVDDLLSTPRKEAEHENQQL